MPTLWYFHYPVLLARKFFHDNLRANGYLSQILLYAGPNHNPPTSEVNHG
jgi:hypothetical protein